MLRRTLPVLALVALLATILAACGGAPAATPPTAPAGGEPTSAPAAGAATDAPVTLRLIAQSTGEGNPPFEAVIAAFQEAHPNITIDAEFFPIGTAYPEVLRTQLQSGNAPDLFYVSPGAGGLVSVLPLAEAGYTADLSSRAWAGDFVPENARDLFFLDGQLTAVPLNIVPISVVYNVAALEQLGAQPPTTMDEFYALCKTAQDNGKALLSVAGANPQNAGLLASALAANHVVAADPDWNTKRAAGEVTFAESEGWQKTLQTILDMQAAGCFIPGAEGADIPQAAPPVAAGDAVGFVIPTGAIGALKGINPDVRLGTFTLPAESADATVIYATASDGIAIYKNSPNLEAAMLFADFFAESEGSNIYASKTGAVSMQAAATGEGLLPELAGIAPLLQDDTRNYPLVQLEWKNPEVFAALGSGVQGLLTGQQTIEDVLTAMDAAWDRQ